MCFFSSIYSFSLSLSLSISLSLSLSLSLALSLSLSSPLLSSPYILCYREYPGLDTADSSTTLFFKFRPQDPREIITTEKVKLMEFTFWAERVIGMTTE